MKGKRDTAIPEFQSLEEEREYWEARGPLAEGHRGRISKGRISKTRSVRERQRKAYMFACWQSETLGCHAHLWVPSWLFWLGWLLKHVIFVTWVKFEQEK